MRLGLQTSQSKARIGWFTRLAAAASAGIAASVAVALDDPPEPVPGEQECTNTFVRVTGPGMPFRTPGDPGWCDPLQYHPPGLDPCAARWSIGPTGEWALQLPPSGQLADLTAHSACWWDIYWFFHRTCVLIDPSPSRTGLDLAHSAGFPLKINRAAAPSIGNFLPPSPTIGGSSVALLPASEANQPTGWNGLTRPVQAGVVDLVTGMPLAQFRQLELPFGSTSFRLIRTRSHLPDMAGGSCGIDNWWDWAGHGWMLSEAPLLLIDSAVWDVVGNAPRTTFLVLDAHHSIPFQRLEDSGRYEAPPRFRARLTHNGQGWANGQWQIPPTWYEVHLYDGALTYRFAVVREDMPDNIWQPPLGIQCPDENGYCRSSVHARPLLEQHTDLPNQPWGLNNNPGAGIPYLGLCTSIQDRLGHTVKITYLDQVQYAIDNPQTGYNSSVPSESNCVECVQSCQSKGQIKRIELVKPDSSVAWTLLYRHRIAPKPISSMVDCQGMGVLPWTSLLPNKLDHLGERVLDSIYVYAGVVDAQLPPDFYTIPTSERLFYSPSQIVPDAMMSGDSLQSAAPVGYSHLVKYGYGFEHAATNTLGADAIGRLQSQPILLRGVVYSHNGANPDSEENFVFKYTRDSSGGDPWLDAIYDQESLDQLAARVGSPLNPSHVALAINDSFWSEGISNQLSDLFYDYAVVAWNQDHWPQTNISAFQDPGNRYIRTDLPVHPVRYLNQVGSVEVRNGHGSRSFFRIHRFKAGNEPDRGNEGLALEPHRSAFYVPYAWHADGSNAVRYTPPSDYTQPRWITLIDEFEDRTAMLAGASLGGNYLISTAATGRRAVHVGASGVLLRDARWTFKGGQPLDSQSAGLGTENVYAPVLDLMPFDLPGNQLHHAGQFDNALRELLLIEHRSVGWSVAENTQDSGVTTGFVRFFEYEFTRHTPTQHGTHLGGGWYPESTLRVEPRAEGISRGQAYVPDEEVTERRKLVPNTAEQALRLYLRENHRPNPVVPGTLPWTGLEDPDRWEYTAEVQHLAPTTTLLGFGDLPAPGTVSLPPGSPQEPILAVTYSLTKRRNPDPYADPPVPFYEWPVEATLTIGPGRQQRPGGDWYFPVERQQFSEDGKLVRTMSGLVRNPMNPASAGPDPLQSLAHTVHLYDGYGKIRHLVADIDPTDDADGLNATPHGRPPEAHVQQYELDALPAVPAGWERIASGGAPARNYITTYLYNGWSQSLSDIFFPNGRRWARRMIVVRNEDRQQSGHLAWNTDNFDWAQNHGLHLFSTNEQFAREYIFNEIELRTAGSSQSTPYSRTLGEIRDYGNRFGTGMPRVTRRVFFAVPTQFEDVQDAVPLTAFLDEPVQEKQPRFTEEQRVAFSIGTNGRGTKADLLEIGPGGDLVEVGSKVVYDLTDVIRERAFDGSITRTVRNTLGQPLRRYSGTQDDAWNDNTDPPSTTPYSAAGLALNERIEYGSGVNDAWLPTVVRRYTYTPSWALEPFAAPPSDDTDGYITKTSYDWRMRPVRVDQYGESATGSRSLSAAPRLSTTLTYLDHASRPLVIATFGAGTLTLSPSLDPTTRDPWDDPMRPSIADLYSLAIKPTSVVEMFYGPDGNTVQRRTYHFNPAAPVNQQLTWHEEHTLSGRGGQTVYEQRPQQPVTISYVDGLGRTFRSTRFGWDGSDWNYPLAQTDYQLDADGNIRGTAQFERVLSAGSTLDAESSAANAIRTRTVSWFDPQKRLTASADLGSESMGEHGTGPDLMIAGPLAYELDPNDGNESEPKINTISTSVPTIDREGLPDWARLTINRYSMLTGRLIWTANPDGTITEFNYDRAGRLARRIENRFGDPGDLQRVTEYEYTLGRLTGIIASRSSGNPSPGDRQVTRLVYGARVLSEQPPAAPGLPPTYTAAENVHSAAVVGRMHLPVATGEPSFIPPNSPALPHDDANLDAGEIVLRYTFDGQIAERIDARGVVFRYFYDALGRLSWVVVGSYDTNNVFQHNLPPSMGFVAVPVDQVKAIRYHYNAENRLSDVVAYSDVATPHILTHTRYEYDSRGNVIREWQGHGVDLNPSPPANTAHIDYDWSYQPTDTPAGEPGHDRLASITYPAPHGGSAASRRRVEFAYGTANSLDDRLSRITELVSGYGSTFSPVAAFEYAGIGRRAAMTLGTGTAAIIADLRAPAGANQPIGLTGLDSFGRVRDLHYRNTANHTLFRAEHAYDVAGNRLYERLTQWPSPSLNTSGGYKLDARSQLHTYDTLHRLTGSEVAELNTTGTGYVNNSLLRSDNWFLDILGNWHAPTGPPLAPNASGRVTTGNLDNIVGPSGVRPAGGTSASGTFAAWADPANTTPSANETLWTVPFTDGRNEVTGVHAPVSTNDGAFTLYRDVTVLHDAAGNLIYDGTYAYQYDAWNRLIQVNAAGEFLGGGLHNPANPYAGIAFGPTLKHYTYDGLGRLIRTQSPFPTPESAAAGDVRSERFYYDGIRRIQETRLDPGKNLQVALSDEDPLIQNLAMLALSEAEAGLDPSSAGVDTSVATLSLENGLLELSEGETSSLGTIPPIYTGNPVVVREYVWGPGDAWHPASVDELLVYYAEGRVAWWPIQDTAGDIAAVCAPAPAGVGGYAEVVAQQRYDAYGQVISADHLRNHPFLAVGHKGLFYDRFDRGVAGMSAQGWAFPPGTEGIGQPETPRLVPFARGVYHVRNRAMLPGGGSMTAVGHEGFLVTSIDTNGGYTGTLSQPGLSSGATAHGRFMQADPNATGMVLVRSASFHGRAFSPGVDDFHLELRHADGANLYEFLGSSSWSRADPLGLSWDPFEYFVDEFIAEDAGSKAAFMGEVIGGFNAIGHIAFQVAQLHPAVGLAVTAYQLANGASLSAGMLLDLLPAGKALGTIGRAYSSYYKGKRLTRGARAYGDDLLELHHVIPQFMLGWRRGRVVTMTSAQHQQYHRLLDDVLAQHRLPRSNQNETVWRTWLEQTPDGPDRARAALIESVDRFRQATNGQIDMMADLWTEMTRQGWLLR